MFYKSIYTKLGGWHNDNLITGKVLDDNVFANIKSVFLFVVW